MKKWIKKRHAVITAIVRPFMALYCRLRYHIKIEKFKGDPKRAYLILLNHQTPFDQFFVGLSFKKPIYYMATEDIFSNGFVSSLIKFLVAPIPIKKQTVDLLAIKTCLQVVREGGSIAIAPEGNRTYSGKTEYMNASIASLAKKLGLPVILYRIEGGYGAEPRWSDTVRRGKMRAYAARVIEPPEYESLSNEELFEIIRDGLFVNEAVADESFFHKKRAEYLERAIYVCPYCGLSVFESENERLRCTKCGREVVYNEDKTLTGIKYEHPFRFINDWYEYQKSFVRELDLTQFGENAIYNDMANISEVIIRKRKNLLYENAKISLYGDRIVFNEGSENEVLLPFDELSVVTVLGRNKLNIYHGKMLYQLKGDKRFNALKYVNIFYHYKHLSKGEYDGEFLGL